MYYLSEDLRQEILRYLSQRPVLDVARLVVAIADLPPVPADVKT